MKHLLLLPLAAILLVANSSFAQDRIFRCAGNEYTNNANDAQSRGCKVVEGGNVTVVQSARPAAGPGPVSVTVANAKQASRIDQSEQRSRDADARSVLEQELSKAESRRAELLKEYNNGEPEKQGSESRNYQKYLDRVADMKAEIARNDMDIAGIRRELGRLQPTTGTP